jgi:hypothetical protein
VYVCVFRISCVRIAKTIVRLGAYDGCVCFATGYWSADAGAGYEDTSRAWLLVILGSDVHICVRGYALGLSIQPDEEEKGRVGKEREKKIKLLGIQKRIGRSLRT